MTHRTAEESAKRSQWDRQPRSPPPSYAGYPPQQYQTQQYEQGCEMAPQQQHKDYHHGGGYEQQPQVVYVQTPPSKVVVKNKHTKDDVAIGFCAGCATAVCCCGCTVM